MSERKRYLKEKDIEMRNKHAVLEAEQRVKLYDLPFCPTTNAICRTDCIAFEPHYVERRYNRYESQDYLIFVGEVAASCTHINHSMEIKDI